MKGRMEREEGGMKGEGRGREEGKDRKGERLFF